MTFTSKDLAKAIRKSKIENSNESEKLNDIDKKDIEREINNSEIYHNDLKIQNDKLSNPVAKLGDCENHYKSIYKYAPVAYVTLDKDGFIIEKNLKACQLFNSNFKEVKPLKFFIHTDDHELFFNHLKDVFSSVHPQTCDVKLNIKENREFFARISSMLFEGRYDTCLTAIIDVDEIKKKEKLISRMAYYDNLTGLPNRVMFMEELINRIKSTNSIDNRFMVMFIDLDNFKKINDTMGHEAGDLLLKVVSKRMKACIRESDILSRMSGDEFTILIQDITDMKKTAEAAERLLYAISQPFTIHNITNSLSASIGISVYPDDGRSAEEIIKNADRAMYKSKINGKSMYCFFDDSMKEEITKKVKIERHLKHALDNNELSIYYLPQIDVATGNIRGIEALMRWDSKKLGVVSPDDFLPLAKESSLMISYGDWVLKNACLNNKEWQNEGLPKVAVTVNISSVQLNQEGFIKRIKEILRFTKLEPKYLELEITEDVLNEDKELAIKKLNELKEIGVGICLDDFGKVYSSLNYLKTLPLKAIKIDGTYIRNISNEKNSRDLIKNIISLAHGLGLKVSAEGVETNEQMKILKKSRCDYMQGFFLYKPMNEKMLKYLMKILKNSELD